MDLSLKSPESTSPPQAIKRWCFVNSTIPTLLTFLFSFIFQFTLYSANRTWSGNTNNAWNTASNWVGNNIPGNGDNVFIPGGLTNYPILSTNVNFKNLTINSSGSGATVTVTAGVFNTTDVLISASGSLLISGGTISSSQITVNGNFVMTGGNVTNSGTLLINNGGVVTQSAGLIYMNSNATSNPKDDLQILTGGVYNQNGGTVSFKDFLPGGGTFNQTGSTAGRKSTRLKSSHSQISYAVFCLKKKTK